MSTKPDPRDHATIHALEKILDKVVDPDTALSPGQLHDVMEMFLTDLHLRKVGGEYWVAQSNTVLAVAKTAVEVSMLVSLLQKLPELGEKNVQTIKDLIELTVKESSDLRKQLVPTVKLLREMACPGETVH